MQSVSSNNDWQYIQRNKRTIIKHITYNLINIKKPKFLLLFCCFAGIGFFSKAQFEGLGSFSTDTVLITQLKIKRVSSVTETITQNGATTVGTVYFDTEGRYIEMTYPFRVRMEYNANGKVTKTATYDSNDTGKVGYWFKHTYDAKDRHVKTEYASYENGKLKISTNSESKIITEKTGVLKMETIGYFYDKIASRTFYLDSVSGIYRFVIVSEYVDQMMAYTGIPGQGLTFHKKTFTRSYVIDNCSYEDKIVYSGDGGVEHITEFEPTYQLRDSKGRILEKGGLDFFEAYEKYTAAHPTKSNNSMPDIFPLGFVKLFLSGKIQSKRKAIVTYTYNTKGLLIAKTDYGNKYTFKYDENDQLIEFTSEGYSTYMIHYKYNDKGLVIKMQLTPGKYDGTGQQTVPKECTYDYTYY